MTSPGIYRGWSFGFICDDGFYADGAVVALGVEQPIVRAEQLEVNVFASNAAIGELLANGLQETIATTEVELSALRQLRISQIHQIRLVPHLLAGIG